MLQTPRGGNYYLLSDFSVEEDSKREGDPNQLLAVSRLLQQKGFQHVVIPEFMQAGVIPDQIGNRHARVNSEYWHQ